MSEDKSLAEKAASTQPTSTDKSAAMATPASATAASVTPGSAPPASLSSPAPASGSDLKKLIPLAIFALAALLFFVVSSFWTSWENGISVKTDDAYVRADVAPLSTRAHGIVLKTLVQDYQKVVPGQVLVELRNEDVKDAVNESQQTVAQVQIKIEDMKSRKSKLDAQIEDAKAQLAHSKASLQQFDSTIAIAKAGIEEAHANLDASAASIKQSDSSIQSATADTVKTALAQKREEALLAEESSTKERVEQVVDEHERSVAALDGQNAARMKAKAEYSSRKAQTLRAEHQLSSVLLDKKKAETVVDSRSADVVARSMERKLLDGEESQLKSELASKKSAADSASVDLGYTTVKAPVAGTVGEVKVKQGQFVNAGAQVVTLISSTPWVIANFRETQTSKIKPGDHAKIDVDALSGKHWNGHVESIAPASGAQFSLLPPDNASGNFTKITQRIPVKIVFDEGSQPLDDLRPGMSVSVAITPSSH